MAKLPPMKKTSKTTASKKSNPKSKLVDDAPLPQAVSKPKAHTRTAKPAEKNRVEKNKEMAVKYLMRRDEMDEATATMVVDSMEPDDVIALNTEAATVVMEKLDKAVERDLAKIAAENTSAPAPSAPATSPAATPVNATEPEEPAEAAEPVDFLTVPALAEHETFAELAIRCRDNAITKNKAEKEYKTDKKVLDSVLENAGIDKLHPVICADVKLVRYTGKSPRYLSDIKLLEAGVDPDIIKKCWVQGEYNDVRITTVK